MIFLTEVIKVSARSLFGGMFLILVHIKTEECLNATTAYRYMSRSVLSKICYN